MKRINRLLIIIMLLCFALSGCGNDELIAKKESKRRPATGDSWTVMIYMSASSLEDKHSRASEVLESLPYDLPENINVIVETGGAQKWSEDNIKHNKLQDYAVQKNGIRLISEHNNDNMGKARTYANFLNRTMEKYPADKYISVIWGEGSGPVGGVAHDMTHNNDSLTPKEIASALAATETKLDIICFDASLMASLEVAAALVPYADYMVASESVMPMSGIDYRRLFEFISDEPYAGAPEVGQVICDSVTELSGGDDSLAAMSVIDLSDITHLMQDFDTMSRGMAQDADDVSKLRAMRARVASALFLGANSEWEGYSNLVDLESLQTKVYSAVKSDYARIKRSISKAVIYKSSGKLYQDLCGISVYYPQNPTATEINKYRELSTSLGYMEYIDKTVINEGIENRTADYKLTGAYIAYESAAQSNVITAEPDLNGKYLLSVTSPDIISKTGVNLYKYNEETGVYFYLLTDDSTYYSNIANTYEYKLKNKILELNKIHVSSYLINDFGISKLYSIPVMYEDEKASIRVLVTESESKKEYDILGMWSGVDSITGIADRKYITLSSGDRITPVYETYGGNRGEFVKGKKMTLVFGGLNIKEKPIDDGEYLLSYTAEDIYGIETESNTTNVTAIKGKMQITK